MEPKEQLDPPPADSGSLFSLYPSGNVMYYYVKVEKKGLGPDSEGSTLIDLGLGIGAGSGRPDHVTKPGKSAFTLAQLHELQRQTLILKYIASGFPVPFHLLLPIWKSIARCSGFANGGIYPECPSLVGFNYQGFDYRGTMDPGQGRCRRTDGKKWRCRREVVPDQKYCERHMHRGRQHSRKHMEASAQIPSGSCRSLNANNTKTTTNSIGSTNMKRDPSIPVPVNLELATPSLIATSNIPAVTASYATCIGGTNGSGNYVVAKKDSAATTPIASNSNTTTLTTHISNIGCNKSDCDNKDNTATTVGPVGAAAENNSSIRSTTFSSYSKHVEDNHFDYRHETKGSTNCVNIYKAGCFVVPGFGFSPNSVLQVVGCSSSYVNCQNVLDAEPNRCRRTDGKKWRCTREVLPDQKYCGRHLHRGAKKQAVASQAVTVAAAAPPPSASSVCLSPPLAIPKKADACIDLNTKLSISIAASPHLMTRDEECQAVSSSSSDATTITDENGSISHLLVLSP